MSVGGRVAFTRDGEFGVEVATWEPDSPGGGYTATQVEDGPLAREIQPGDSFWWQGEKAYWTVRSLETGELLGWPDVVLKRTCNSYALDDEGKEVHGG